MRPLIFRLGVIPALKKNVKFIIQSILFRFKSIETFLVQNFLLSKSESVKFLTD